MKIFKVTFSLILSAILFNSSMAMEVESDDKNNYAEDMYFVCDTNSVNAHEANLNYLQNYQMNFNL